ncbi:hypothetical protein NP233_g2454 [Leucocoprinus birnbaumii]|uniref:BTB domain-containing protein n=1 Tax=Leucocoprinus birnbaumii TaxID=56174 RepID=A0AAD5VYE0_9AGAR|nr:hypothetical protein NP233_g2454 [Leucocoprinus birnbaumii]
MSVSILPEIEEAKPQYHPSFDDEDADTVLSSNDHVLFRLSRITLRKSSGYFRNLFDSAKGQETSNSTVYEIPFPTVPLERVLLLISGLPLAIEKLSFSEVEDMIEVMQFLDTPGPIATMRSSIDVLRQFPNEPISVYGLATKMGWDEVAQKAAEATLPIDIYSTVSKDATRVEKELGHISTSGSLLALFRMHQRRKDIFRQQIRDRTRFQLLCGVCCDPTHWRLLVGRLIEELDHDCSGRSISKPGAIEGMSEATKCWARRPCNTRGCDYRHGLSNKLDTLKKIRSMVEGLPKNLRPEDKGPEAKN